MIKTDIPRNDAVTERELRNEKTAERVAVESMVLLKNDGALPLKTDIVALYGAGAGKTITGGTGSGKVNARRDMSVEEGLREAGFNVLSGEWIQRYARKRAEGFESFKENARVYSEKTGMPHNLVMMHDHFDEPAPVPILKEELFGDKTDTAIYVIARNSGEGADRKLIKGDYYLYDEELDNLKTLSGEYKNIIVILNIGGVISVKELAELEYVNAVLLMGQAGSIGGRAVARILSGEISPSGKLADTWAVNYGDYPEADSFGGNDGDVNDEYYREGIFTGYRYFDTLDIRPFYPFGYGLSYTGFRFFDIFTGLTGSRISIKLKVENTGKEYAGKEVVQVYVSQPEGKLKKPYQVLAAFKKTGGIEPGGFEEITLDFDMREVSSYSEEEAAWILEPGDYIVRVGNSSQNTEIAASVRVEEVIVCRRFRHLFEPEEALKETDFERARPEESLGGVLRLLLDPASVKTEEPSYEEERRELSEAEGDVRFEDVLKGERSPGELVSKLSIKELCEFTVGTNRFDEADDSLLVGGVSNVVPGAAGDTTSICLESLGIPNMIMADGPAGLRLKPHFKTDKNGELVEGGEIVGESATPFDPSVPEEETTDYYQYCTALPVEWNMAQSWNEELIFEAGELVGEEMELFGIDLWLAPALNIHRNPLCGRNYEYYSEDPFLSGKAAAAVTRGVQSHKGRGVTIKHFAANNQEANRYFTNSHISERALREIYLKGFEIAVKESAPLCVMTSYNLLNGIHTANSRVLLTDILRSEWSFDGLVMTDWCTSIDAPDITGPNNSPYPISASTGCVYAGNDLQMPGCKENVEDLIEAVETGKAVDGYMLTKADIQYCAMNVIKTVLRTRA